VLLAGFDNVPNAFSLAYDPPITLCGGAPTVGDSWSTHVMAYDVSDMSLYAEFDITYGALEEVTLDVPAGSFACIGVGQLVAKSAPLPAALRGFTLDGRRAATSPTISASSVSDWFSPGTGVVQYDAGGAFELASYGGPTPTLATSWGRLKALYR
jgi:hypothetical protein